MRTRFTGAHWGRHRAEDPNLSVAGRGWLERRDRGAQQ
jgi:hypothetical protein